MAMRRWVGLAGALVLGLATLTGCSAGHNGVAAIGFDSEGRLVGGIKVCRADTGVAALSRGTTTIGRWERDSKGHGTETWRLTAVADGSWSRTAPQSATTGRDDTGSPLTFRVDSWGRGWFASLDVTDQQLAALAPGHLLVRVDGPSDPSGYATTVTKVIAMAALADQPCPDP